jgi:anti-sigma regulatory factor (Ser/Thr protein kinase)
MVAPFSELVSAQPASLRRVRRMFRCWLDTARWPSEEATDLVLGVNEAVTNAIEHACAPAPTRTILVTAREVRLPPCSRQAVINVIDHGHWRPMPVSAGTRGRGIAVMRAIAESLEINPSPAGTSVTMIGWPVPDLPEQGASPSLSPLLSHVLRSASPVVGR